MRLPQCTKWNALCAWRASQPPASKNSQKDSPKEGSPAERGDVPRALQLGPRSAVRERQPTAELFRRFVRCRSVERHRRRRAARGARYMRPLLVEADARYLDAVRACVDDLFETMQDHRQCLGDNEM